MSTAASATTDNAIRDLSAGSRHADNPECAAECHAAQEHSGSSERAGHRHRQHSDRDHREYVIEPDERVDQAVPQPIDSASDMGQQCNHECSSRISADSIKAGRGVTGDRKEVSFYCSPPRWPPVWRSPSQALHWPRRAPNPETWSWTARAIYGSPHPSTAASSVSIQHRVRSKRFRLKGENLASTCRFDRARS